MEQKAGIAQPTSRITTTFRRSAADQWVNDASTYKKNKQVKTSVNNPNALSHKADGRNTWNEPSIALFFYGTFDAYNRLTISNWS
jgi:hypothetical protein